MVQKCTLSKNQTTKQDVTLASLKDTMELDGVNHLKMEQTPRLNLFQQGFLGSGAKSQIREQMSGRDLHVCTLKFLALKKLVISLFRGQFIKKVLCNFSVRMLQCFQKKIFFYPEKVKKRASKVAHNRPRPFQFTVQPRPQPRIDLSYPEISGPDICSLICALYQ